MNYNNLSTVQVQERLAELSAEKDNLTTQLESVQSTINALKMTIGYHTYDHLGVATRKVEIFLTNIANEDCEGSYNVGADSYELIFRVDNKLYKAKLECEYNRHDKTYYYVDETEFSYEEIFDWSST